MVFATINYLITKREDNFDCICAGDRLNQNHMSLNFHLKVNFLSCLFFGLYCFSWLVSHPFWPPIYKCHFTFTLYIGKGCLIFDLLMVTLHAPDNRKTSNGLKTGCLEVVVFRISVKYQSKVTFTGDKCCYLKSSRNKSWH